MPWDSNKPVIKHLVRIILNEYLAKIAEIPKMTRNVDFKDYDAKGRLTIQGTVRRYFDRGLVYYLLVRVSKTNRLLGENSASLCK